MTMRTLLPKVMFSTALLVVATMLDADGQVSSPSCPVTSAVTTFSSTTLTSDCTTSTTTGCTTKSGVVATGSSLTLAYTGGNFQSVQMGITANVVFAAVGDFNHDGWPDFAGAPYVTSSSPLTIFQNQTWQNENCTTTACTAYSGAAPTWGATAVTPKFVTGLNLHAGSATNYNGMMTLAAGDFDGDGWDDLLEIYAAGGQAAYYSKVNMYINKAANSATASGCPTGTGAPNGGCATFSTAYDPFDTTLNAFRSSTISVEDTGTNVQVIDYNKDGHLDVMIGTGETGGSIHILQGTCTEVVPTVITNGIRKCVAGTAKFTDGGYLMQNLKYSNVYAASGTTEGFGTNTSGGEPVFFYGDFDYDGMNDLIVSAPNCCNTSTRRLRLFKGCAASNVPTPGTCGPNKLETVASQSLPGTSSTTAFPGDGDTILGADFTLDGKIDVIVGTDNYQFGSSLGGQSWLWKNNSTSTPFSGFSTQVTTRNTSPAFSVDYDVGFVFDYDKDPQHTPDAMMADGNGAGAYYILADRTSGAYVPCGDVTGLVDIGTLASADAVITTARITANFTAPTGASVQFYASNESPANWVGPLSTCSTAPTTDYCASFPKPVGHTIQWKAHLCGTGANTPTLTSVGIKYDSTTAADHYRSGVVVNDGVTYVGAFRQPGDRGRLYAINASLSGGPLWEASAKLDAMSDASRNIYTSVSGASMALTTANATSSSALQTLLGANSTTAPGLVTWIRSARFGLGSATSPLSKLGSVISSSPAVLSKPGRPNWYVYASSTTRGYVDAFVTSMAGAIGTANSRMPLVLFGAKDGMVHAVYSIPTNTADTHNGQEAWAYIPPTVAAGMMADKTAMDTANAAATDGANHPVATAYPDGSITLFDYYNGSTAKTVAMVSEGYGGRNFSVFDVTNTVNPTTYAATGPTPMWNATAGDTSAGPAYAKPILARVQIGGSDRYLAIAATGADPNDPTPSPATGAKGRIVAAYDVANGTVLWKFQAKCAVTSELTAFETDDTLEPAAPALDGYIDRVVFADQCGYVYKLNPAVDRSGGYIANSGYGSISIGNAPDGSAEYALFSTSTSTGALGASRIIAGTIGARIDASTRMVLYFGTGGIESQAQNLTNEFYAVYADNGTIRSKYTGTCTAGICEKFYGGVVVTPTQVIFTRTVDAQIATNSCDDGSTVVQAYEVNANGSNAFVSDFTAAQSSAVLGALYGDAGAIYFATLGGDVTRIGTPRAASAGGDTSANVAQGTGTGQNGSGTGGSSSTAFSLLGWRTVL